MCETFDVAYNIIGGGEEGDKTAVRTKEGQTTACLTWWPSQLLTGRSCRAIHA